MQVLSSEGFSEWMVVNVMPSMRGRFDRDVEASGMQPADWLRRWLEETLGRVASEEIVEGGGVGSEGGSDVPIASQLAAALAQIEGLE